MSSLSQKILAYSGVLLLSPGFLSQDWQAVSDKPFSFISREEGFLLKQSSGVAYLVHPLSNGEVADELIFSLKTDKALELTVIPNAAVGNYTFEMQRRIQPSADFQEYQVSMRHPYFRGAPDLAIKLVATEPVAIVFREIRLNRLNFFGKISRALKDYWQTAPYSGFIVNLFPTPRVFGHEAFWYFLPVFGLGFLLLFLRKLRKVGLVGLLVLWLVTVFRMDYEFIRYQIEDRRGLLEKDFRTYGDFYEFANWLKEYLPPEARKINFYYLENEHFPRLLQYYLYPVEVIAKGESGGWHVVYHKKDIQEKLRSEGVKAVAEYSDDSGIWQKP